MFGNKEIEMKKVLLFLCALLIVFSLSSCAKKEAGEYKVGDIGPAGGYIFYDKGKYSDGWRYLEAAPADLRTIAGKPTVDKSDYRYDSGEEDFILGFYRTYSDGTNLYVNGSGKYNKKDCTGTAVGTGNKNTELLVKAMGNMAYIKSKGPEKTSAYAAKICSDLVYNGFNVPTTRPSKY